MTAIDYRRQTVLITGASAGIGVEFAREFARRGSNLVLVARRTDRLDAVAAELENQYGITAHVLTADLSEPLAGQLLAAEVDRIGIKITSVVNNAGFGTHGLFHDEDPARLADEIAVNVSNLVDISRAFIDRLRSNGNGVLLNVASMAAYTPSPRMAVYAATKAFVLSFTEALWQESLGSGVRVLALSPGATETEFFDVAGDAAGAGAKRQTPGEVVKVAFKALDAKRSTPSVVSGRSNKVAASLGRFVSRRRAVLLLGALTSRAVK